MDRRYIVQPIGIPGFSEAAIAVVIAVVVIIAAIIVNATVLTSDQPPTDRPARGRAV
jgi:hypothetical protein